MTVAPPSETTHTAGALPGAGRVRRLRPLLGPAVVVGIHASLVVAVFP